MDIPTDAGRASTKAELARILRALRHREASRRQGLPLSLRQIADRTGWSHVAVGFYLNGSRLPSAVRFDELVALLGADAGERTALTAARRRVAEAVDAASTIQHPAVQTIRAPVPAPCALPPPVAGFIGRDAPLALLDGMLSAAGGSVRIGAVVGMPGVGKTALVVHWAHQVPERYPAGRLYVDLQGYSPRPQLSVMDALGVLLAGLGVKVDALRDVTSRLDRYRSLLHGQSTLVVLDNAGGLSQVRTLLPPPPCVALVTSRGDLDGIDDLGDVTRISLDTLPEADALALLRALVGERVGREPLAARALAARCGYLPLAVRVAAEQANRRPGASLADLVGELDEDAGHLDALAVPGDVRADLRTVFTWSLHRLPAPATRLFALMALIPGFDADRYGLAALAGLGLSEADELAQTLVAAHLVESRVAGRFMLHDLLRAYAAETVDDRVSTEDRQAAVGRLMRYYVRVATAAVDLMFPTNRHVRPTRDGPCSEWQPEPSGPDLADAESAAAWLAVERVNLVRACGHGAVNGWPPQALALALVLGRYLEDLHYEDALSVHTAAAEVVKRLGDGCGPAERAGVWTGLGLAHWRLGHLVLARRHLESALEANHAAGNSAAAARNLIMLGVVLDSQGRYREAITYQRRGLDVARTSGVPAQEALALFNLAFAHWRVEEFQTALDLNERALPVAEQAGESWPLGPIREGLAWALAGLGRYEEALVQAEQAVAAYRSFAQVVYRLRAEAAIGSALHGTGRHAEALCALTEALTECREHGNPRPTVLVLNTLGETWRDIGDAERALACHAEALELAERHNYRAEHTRALVGIGDAHADGGDAEWARRYWRRAYAEYTATDLLAAAERVRARWEHSGRGE